ncbi:MAG: hypothetical protein WCI02_09400 [Planctomycetota bacterium]
MEVRLARKGFGILLVDFAIMNDLPPNSVVVPRVAIDWYRSAPWWRIAAHSIGISWRASHLLLCGIALLLTQLFTGMAFTLFQPDGITEPVRWVSPTNEVASANPFHFDGHLPVSKPGGDAVAATTLPGKLPGPWYHGAPDSFLEVWRRLTLYPYQALEQLSLKRAAYLLVSFGVVLFVWSFVGGCLSRRSIQELGTRITSPWMDTVRLVRRRWLSIAWAIAMPLAMISLVALIPLLLGWLSNLPGIGPWLAGVLMLPVVVLSIGLGWCASISLIGFPLSTAAIVAEKQADAFDGVSRAAAYTFQRPVTLILCVAVAQWIGHFAGAIVGLVLNTGYSLVSQSFSLGAAHPLHGLGTALDGVFAQFVPWLMTAFGFSFFWTASSAVYLLLRREVDNAEFDLIDMNVQQGPKPLPELPEAPKVHEGASKPASEPATQSENQSS